MTTTIGELCMGYGGLGMGLSLALGGDTRVAWAVEYDKHPSAIIAHRYPGVPNYGDVKTTDWTQVEPVDWLTAGYPCQPFSLAGLRKGADDPRHLWPGVADAIRVLRPRNVLLENVAAHLRLGFDTVLADLADLGYAARWGVVRASEAGAPHGRARLFIVAADAEGVRGDGREGVRRRATDAVGDRVRALPVGGREDDAGSPGVVAADAEDDGRERRRSARAGRPGPADGGVSAADADRAGGEALVGRPGTGDARRLQSLDAGDPTGDVQWGAYGPAVARWASVTGRPAPRPTEPGRNGERLSPRFVEWMLGLPDGWVTDVPGIPRNAQLKALGNGVVPQQAALACGLLGVAPAEAVAA